MARDNFEISVLVGMVLLLGTYLFAISLFSQNFFLSKPRAEHWPTLLLSLDPQTGHSTTDSQTQSNSAVQNFEKNYMIANPIESRAVRELDIRLKNVTNEILATFSPGLKPMTKLQDVELRTGSISFFTGQASCTRVCKLPAAGAGACSRDWFAQLGTRGASLAACSAQNSAPTQTEATTTGSSALPTCEAEPGPEELRLCPCAPPPPPPLPPPQEAVAVRKVVEVLLAEQEMLELEGMTQGARDGAVIGSPTSSLLQLVQAERVAFYRGAGGESCDGVCERQALRCDARWFEQINQCEVLMAAWPRSLAGGYYHECKVFFSGNDLPAQQWRQDALLLNKDTQKFPTTCASSHADSSRLCPCAYLGGPMPGCLLSSSSS